jgi:hypothetical protein
MLSGDSNYCTHAFDVDQNVHCHLLLFPSCFALQTLTTDEIITALYISDLHSLGEEALFDHLPAFFA